MTKFTKYYVFMHFYDTTSTDNGRWVPEVGLQSDGKITIWYEDDTIESDTTLDDFLGKVVTLRYVQTTTAKAIYVNDVQVASKTGTYSYTGTREVGLRDGTNPRGNRAQYHAPNAGSMDVFAFKVTVGGAIRAMPC